MIKKLILNTIFYISTFFIFCCFFSCKKGKEDPAISLRSRTARITNKWEVYTSTRVWQNGIYLGSWTVSNNRMEVNSNNFPTDYYDYFFSLSIKEDYTYSIDQSFINLDTTLNSSYHTDGKWNFLNKSNGYKNKERIILSPLKTVSKNSNSSRETLLIFQNSGEIIEIDQLRHKELTITSNYKKNDSVYTKTQMCLKPKK
jgi:hypothetical protein